MPDLTDLEIIMHSKVPLIVIETFEEPRAIDMILRVGVKQSRPVYAWSITEGLKRIDLEHSVAERLTNEPDATLTHIKASGRSSIFILCDIHPFLQDNAKNVRLLKEIAMTHEKLQHSVILLSHSLNIPPEIKRYCAQMELSLPSDEELLHMVREEAAIWSTRNQGQKVKTDSRTLEKLVANLRGMTYSDARRLARGVIVDDGAITHTDLPDLNRAKFELLDMGGVLGFEYDTAEFADVGGLDGLKRWLQQRRGVFHAPDGKRDAPKGILLLGVQGSGKSLAAKAVAGMWGVPLLRMDIGALYNKFIGESERNLRDALKMADTLAPCVLWLDEIEKGLAGDDSDNGTSRRLLGTLLTWMAERKTPVFIVATSNDISRLPPELVRKGRLDEIFFVDLPDVSIRRDIFSIHLRKRQQDAHRFNLDQLAQASDGFSGAEIEQAVVAGLYRCAAENIDLDDQHILHEIAVTRPLSVVMAEPLARLRLWAEERTVPAN